jgi:transposase
MKNTAETVTIPKVEYEKLLSEFADLKNHNVELNSKVEWLMEQFRLSKHKQFGASSEKSSQSEYDQLNLFNETEVTSDILVPEPELFEIEKHFRKRKNMVNDSNLPNDLPVEIVEYVLPDDERTCLECEGDLHIMGRELIRRELKLIPAKAVIVEYSRCVYSCRECENHGYEVPIIKAEISNPVIKGSFASAEAIAHVATQKFVMAIPLYRQEQEWNRYGINLSRQTMSNWLIKATFDWLEPIYDTLKEILCLCTVIHADETTLQVLHESGKSPQTKSYMWLYRTSGDTDSPIVLYEYQPNRKAEHPKAFLRDFRGYLHADGYDGYHNLPDKIKVVGCFAHARRKFDEAIKGLSKKEQENSTSGIGKRFCDKLFSLERGFAKLTAEERFAKRQELSKPVFDEFYEWLNTVKIYPKTGLYTAVVYAKNQRKYLERYLEDGRLEISNNRAERSIKPFVIGRKNWLFANTPRGAKASAILFSIIETAKENGLNPYEYLTYIFKNAPNLDVRNNLDDLETLMPWNVPD